jgi:competence protein ComFC
MLKQSLAPFKEPILSLLFPVQCATCGRSLRFDRPGHLCGDCVAKIRWIQPPACPFCGRPKRGLCECGQKKAHHFDRVFACAFYEGLMKEALHTFKFNRRKSLENFFSEAMQTFAESHLKSLKFDAVLSVPLDLEKKRERGFNQSEALSKKIAESLRLSELSKTLGRKKSASPQALLAKNERRKNIEGCFFAKKPLGEAKNLLLIDDIFTTGLTVSECAKTLKNMGAKDVTVLVAARGR